MPRFYFHVRAGRERLDEEGTELPDLQAARREALRFVGDMLTSEPDDFTLSGMWSLDVADFTGATLYRIRLLGEETHIHHGRS